MSLPLPNLARRCTVTDCAVFKEVDDQVHAELRDAAIAVSSYEMFRFAGKGVLREVPTQHVGHHARWTFHRAWKYWVATGPGIPPDEANYFHWIWGREVRVEGHAGGIPPYELNRGFAIGEYHIDTQAGLKAFRTFLDSIYLGEKPK